MTEERFTLIWAVMAVAIGIYQIVFTKSTVRSALKWQRRNPDAPHPQWLYLFARVIGWSFVVVGVTVGGFTIAGSLA
ncbi:hypothetical protein ACH47X_15935 [Promicromonospora kroppenstedtii]|uniref:Uncharacterized protein n=1 Tax=Promicromonospora kroppenstedtii TaxID=440482 RepID=A0ABW7XM14_9MICO